MNQRGYPILTYHSINYAKKESSHKSMMVTPEKFSRQMYVLNALGYRCISMRDLKPYLAGEKKGKVIGLTFDDGYKDNIEYALPTSQSALPHAIIPKITFERSLQMLGGN